MKVMTPVGYAPGLQRVIMNFRRRGVLGLCSELPGPGTSNALALSELAVPLGAMDLLAGLPIGKAASVCGAHPVSLVRTMKA
jgi:hypothetical protein